MIYPNNCGFPFNITIFHLWLFRGDSYYLFSEGVIYVEGFLYKVIKINPTNYYRVIIKLLLQVYIIPLYIR